MKKKNKIEEVAERIREALRKGLRKGWMFVKGLGQGFKGNLKNFGKGKGRRNRSVAKIKAVNRSHSDVSLITKVKGLPLKSIFSLLILPS